MKYFLKWSLSSACLLVGLFCHAQTQCNLDPKDPYSPSAVQQVGKYKGQCLDTSTKRAVDVLSQNPEEMVIANFHKGQNFYIAHVPLHGIQKISYVVVDLNAHPVNFGAKVNIAHTEMRLVFNPDMPIRLETQAGGNLPAGQETDVMLSFNYMAPAGVPYDPVAGIDGTLYGSALRFFSTSDEVTTRFVNDKINMYEIPLNVDTQAAGSMLAYALNLSDRYQYSEGYDTWTNNCTTQEFDIFDKGLGLKNQQPFRFQVDEVGDTSMVPGFLALGQRGLVDSQTKILLVNTEFGYPLFPSWSNPYYTQWSGASLKEVQAKRATPYGL